MARAQLKQREQMRAMMSPTPPTHVSTPVSSSSLSPLSSPTAAAAAAAPAAAPAAAEVAFDVLRKRVERLQLYDAYAKALKCDQDCMLLRQRPPTQRLLDAIVIANAVRALAAEMAVHRNVWEEDDSGETYIELWATYVPRINALIDQVLDSGNPDLVRFFDVFGKLFLVDEARR